MSRAGTSAGLFALAYGINSEGEQNRFKLLSPSLPVVAAEYTPIPWRRSVESISLNLSRPDFPARGHLSQLAGISMVDILGGSDGRRGLKYPTQPLSTTQMSLRLATTVRSLTGTSISQGISRS